MKVKEMRELLGLSQNEFSKMYGIPRRTIQNWENDVSKCPDYVSRLLERAVMEDYENRR